MVVLESTNVSLTCKATGYPEPYVMWRREDGEDIRYNGENGNCIFMNFYYTSYFLDKFHLYNVFVNGLPTTLKIRNGETEYRTHHEFA